MLTKQETLLGRSAREESRRIAEPRRTALPQFTVSGFLVMGLVSTLSLGNHSNPGSSLVVCPSLSQDGSQ